MLQKILFFLFLTFASTNAQDLSKENAVQNTVSKNVSTFSIEAPQLKTSKKIS